MSSSSGRKNILCLGGAALISSRQYHPAGATGSVNAKLGRIGRPVFARFRYIGANLAAVYSLYTTDRAAWEGNEITIIDEAGTTFTRCYLSDDGIKNIRKPTAGIPGGAVFADFEAFWTSWE